jgi:hypothetical protein
MSTVVLKIVAHEDHLLKVVWGDGEYPTSWPPYFIHRNQFEEAIADCRSVLNELVGEYLDLSDTWEDATRSGGLNLNGFVQVAKSRYGAVLRRIARAGAVMYFQLFRGAADPEISARVESWLAELPGPVRLLISCDASVHAPWGLVFAGDEETIPPGESDIAAFSNFWAMKYQLAVLYSGMAPKSLRQPRRRETFRSLWMLNREAFNEGASRLGGDTSHEVEAVRRFLDHPEGSAEDFASCRKKWPLLLDKDCLVYVFAHTTGSTIKLSESDRISLAEFRRRFLEPRRRAARTSVPECLLILNGCNTSVGDLDNGFLSATAEAGCCGFVGNEAAAPTEFAMRFGAALVDALVHSGVSILEAVDALRRRHWPLGLLYGCYSHPDFRIEFVDGQSSLPYAPEENFSFIWGKRQ